MNDDYNDIIDNRRVHSLVIRFPWECNHFQYIPNNNQIGLCSLTSTPCSQNEFPDDCVLPYAKNKSIIKEITSDDTEDAIMFKTGWNAAIKSIL